MLKHRKWGEGMFLGQCEIRPRRLRQDAGDAPLPRWQTNQQGKCSGNVGCGAANGVPVEEKIQQLETKYDIKVTNGLEGKFEAMCNYSKGVYDDGMEKGIAGAVDILKRMGMNTSKIVEQLMIQYGLSKEDADKYVRHAEPQ